MKGLSKPDDERFTRMLRRDAFVLLLIAMASSIAIVLIGVLTYFGNKYNF